MSAFATWDLVDSAGCLRYRTMSPELVVSAGRFYYREPLSPLVRGIFLALVGQLWYMGSLSPQLVAFGTWGLGRLGYVRSAPLQLVASAMGS